MADGPLIQESQEVIEHRLLTGDYGPDLAVTLPREHWLLLVTGLSEIIETYPLGIEPVDRVVREMRLFALHAMASAARDSMAADNREVTNRASETE